MNGAVTSGQYKSRRPAHLRMASLDGGMQAITNGLGGPEEIVESPGSYSRRNSLSPNPLSNSQTSTDGGVLMSRDETLIASTLMRSDESSTVDEGAEWSIKPVIPSHSSRYDSRSPEPAAMGISSPIPAGPSSREEVLVLGQHGAVPIGWKEYIHVGEGLPYFYNPQHRIVTAANMRDTDVKAVILECHRQIEMMCKATCSSESPYELCLELDMEKRTVGYYCVRHDIDDPYVFWWQPVLSQIFDQDIKHFQALVLHRQSEYWMHRQYFPLPDKEIRHHEYILRPILAAWGVDHMTSAGSTAAFPAEQCHRFLATLNEIKDEMSDDVLMAKVWTVARLMQLIINSRLANRYGQPDARVDRLQNFDLEQDDRDSNRLVIADWIAFILLLGAHKPHLKRLQMFWCERIAYTERWQSFVKDLVTDCNDTNLLAAVLLAGGIGFLQLPNVDGSAVVRSCCITSVMFALCSLTMGLHHVWKHRAKQESSALVATDYMNASVSSRFGHLTLAVLLSLPLALLLWSIASFAVAITYFAFLKRSGVQQWLGVGATTATAAGMCLSVGITLYFFWGIWERTDDRFSIVTLLNSAFSLVSWSARKREVESEASPDIEKGSPEPSVAEKPSAVKRFTM